MRPDAPPDCDRPQKLGRGEWPGSVTFLGGIMYEESRKQSLAFTERPFITRKDRKDQELQSRFSQVTAGLAFESCQKNMCSADLKCCMRKDMIPNGTQTTYFVISHVGSECRLPQGNSSMRAVSQGFCQSIFDVEAGKLRSGYRRSQVSIFPNGSIYFKIQKLLRIKLGPFPRTRGCKGAPRLIPVMTQFKTILWIVSWPLRRYPLQMWLIIFLGYLGRGRWMLYWRRRAH